MIPLAAGVVMGAMLLAYCPTAPLGVYVETLWYCDRYQAVHRKERVLPNGRFQIVMNLSTGLGAVAGMRSRHIVIETGAIQSTMGVVLRPSGARR